MTIQDLEKRLREASYEYYTTGKVIMSDDEYDSLCDQLRKMDPGNAFLKEVGAKESLSSGWKKRKHRMAMGSLEKVKNITEALDWCRNRTRQLGGV